MANPVLLLDDQRLIHEIAREAVNQARADCLYTRSLNAAKSHLDKNAFSLIITDIELGDGNGLDFVDRIRRERGMSHIPIIVMSQHSDMATIKKAMALGADDYITKPFTLKRMVEAIKAWQSLHNCSLVLDGLSREQARIARLTATVMRQTVQAAISGEEIPYQMLRSNCLSILNANRDSEVMAALKDMKDRNMPAFLHGTKLAAYLGMMVWQLNLPEAEIMDAISAGMLHDIGMMGMFAEALNGSVSCDDHTALVVQHITYAQEILKAQPANLPPLVTDIVTMHHERLDGSGPLGIRGKDMSDIVKAVCIVDEFLERRGLRASEPVSQILESLEENPGFDAGLLATFKRVSNQPSRPASAKAHNVLDSSVCGRNQSLSLVRANKR